MQFNSFLQNEWGGGSPYPTPELHFYWELNKFSWSKWPSLVVQNDQVKLVKNDQVKLVKNEQVKVSCLGDS